MEFFNKATAIRLGSHLGKYLVADEDEQTVRQSRNGSSRKARWKVEFFQGNSHVVRLKSCHGRYLTATNVPFLLGMTGNKVLQAIPTKKLDSAMEWEPIRDGFQVKLRSLAGKFLCSNGGTPQWRSSITHDTPHRSATKDWVLWKVDDLEIPDSESFTDFQSPLSNFPSMPDSLLGFEP